jgi:hypothetical protein
MMKRVGLTTIPVHVRALSLLADAISRQVAGPPNRIRTAGTSGESPSDGPTARARVEGKRGPRTRALSRCMRGGERLATGC